MGRSQNSFSSMVGRAAETINEEKVTLPEKDLWVAVLCRAVLDACKGPPDLDMTRAAKHYPQKIIIIMTEIRRVIFLKKEAITSDLFVKWRDAIRSMFKTKLEEYY